MHHLLLNILKLNYNNKVIEKVFIFLFGPQIFDGKDFVNVMKYCIISIKPKKIIFNINFTQYFFRKDEDKDNIGYNMTEAESCYDFILSDSILKDLDFTISEMNEITRKIII